MRIRSIMAIAPLLMVGISLTGCGSQESTDPTASNESGSATGTSTAVAKAKKPAGPTVDPLHPLVELKTTVGTVTIELDMVNAPVSSNNFLEYVNSSHYDGTLFHYVEDGSMILGGGFTTAYEAKPTSPPIRNEAHNGLKNVRGTIAMSRFPDSIDSATCQFFINLSDNTALDYKDQSAEGYGYCVFGKVIKGLDVAEKIAKLPVQDAGDFVSTPKDQVIIQSAKIPVTVR